MARRVVFLGFGCNNRCLSCAQGDLRETLGAVPGADTTRAVEATVAGEDVVFLGGEPTLSEALPALVALAHARGAAQILVQSNGRRLAYPAYADALFAASNRLALDISLFGSTSAMHDYHTRTPGSFAQTARGIRRAAAARVPVGVTVVVTRSNFRHLAEIAQLVRALGADALHLAPLQPLGSAAGSATLAPNTELAAPHIAAGRASAARLNLRLVLGDPAQSELAARFAGIGPTSREAAAELLDPAPSPRLPVQSC